MSLRSLLLPVLLLSMLAAAAPAQEPETETGLPIPRFVSLRADEVNVRTGPGSRYPVDWVFVRKALPVEIVAEFDTWRRIRDVEGTEGWVHQSMLSGGRSLLVTGDIPATLRTEPRDDAPAVARAEPGVLGRLVNCPGPPDPAAGWCYCEVSGYGGWLRREDIWGLYPAETIE